MSVLKVVEILANSDKGWEDAAQNAVTHAAQTIKNIKSVYINEQYAVVRDNNITEFRVNAKITFEVK